MSELRASDETIDSPTPGVPAGAGGSRVAAPHDNPESIGPFRILERIGEGGMGVIYKAEQRSPVRRVVALKVIKLGMDTKEVLARFEAERQALALMSHPNIARVLDAGATDTGRPFFAMEFVAGVPLTRYCDDQRLTTRQRLELFEQVCRAVQHAHQKGIIHRDLKPSNILVTIVDGKPVPKVIDFGIAKATSQALTAHTLYTQTGALIGTPEYMSPEQAQTSGLDVDTRTDIYSLGVILYELLTGTLPFDPKALRTAGLDGMARMIKEHEPQKPSTRLVTVAAAAAAAASAGSAGSGNAPPTTTTIGGARDTRTLERELRGDLDWIVLRAMEKDRTRRYESAAALAQDVENHLNDEPVTARPPSAGYRVGKFVRRHKGAVVGAAAVLAALLLGIVGTTIGLLRARENERVAIRQQQAAESARENEKTANLFLRDLLISFGSPVEGKAGVARAAARLDEGWLKDQPDTLMASRIALGMFYLQQNDAAQSERQFQAVIAMARRPDGSLPVEISAVIHRGRGLGLWMRKQLPEAEGELRLAIDDYRKIPGAGATLAQLLFGLSAVRQAQGDVAESQKLLREATRIAATEPSMRGYMSAQRDQQDQQGAPASGANAALCAGKFDQAMRGYVRACMDDPSNHWNWYHLSCLELYLDDTAAYRDSAMAMLIRFSGTDVSTIAERTAKVCLLTPSPVGEMAKLTELVDHALASDQARGVYPWFCMTKALAEYRAGRFESALQFLEKAKVIKSATAQATMGLIAAMAQSRLGNPAAAKAALDQALMRISADVREPTAATPIDAPENWLICQILRREAEETVLGKRQPASMPVSRPTRP